ncbi:MAG: hypothetical protein QOI10_3475 [Solirubrobacterales bacterium]|jgi:hypothetical protein|nr:hypothetical protein [Solirubrobacterales bacterium]
MNGNLKRLIVGGDVDHGAAPDRHRSAGLVGLLCVGASICALASALLLEAGPPLVAFALAGFGLLMAGLCFLAPWDRIGAYTVELAPACATLAIGIASTAIDPTYGFYLVLVAGFVAYTFTEQRAAGPHLALIALALVAPVALEPEGTRKAVACALIYGPGVIGVFAGAVYLRRSAEARERAHREFAADALALASRISSRVGPSDREPIPAGPWPQPPLAPARSVGIARVVRRPTPVRTSARLAWTPATALAAAGVLLTTLLTTGAILRDGGGGSAPAVKSARLADELPPSTTSRPTSRSTTADRARRGARSSAIAEAPVETAPAAAPAGPQGDSAQAGSSPRSPAAEPAADPARHAPVPVRPQQASAADADQSPPPTPVQQGGPATPVTDPLGVVQQVLPRVAPPQP